jgi:uncharacterized protein (DUF1810 family)
MSDPFGLQRFVEAQEPVIDTAMGELRAGRKRSHWMWFVFPQIEGLGRSDMARRYAIFSLAEARTYVAHPILGPRLLECSALVLMAQGRTAREIFGAPDDLKFWSSMTLFFLAEPSEVVFRACLRKYFDGRSDPATVGRVGAGLG